MEAAYCGDNRDVSKSSYYVIIAEVKLEWRCKLSYRLYVASRRSAVPLKMKYPDRNQYGAVMPMSDARSERMLNDMRLARIIIHRMVRSIISE